MDSKKRLQRYRKWYALLLCLFPKSFRTRYGKSMEQTFTDICRERIEADKGLLLYAVLIFIETSASIIEENRNIMLKQYKFILRAMALTILLLVIPLVAMQFSDEVVWDVTDFVVAGVLIFGAGLTFELISRKSSNARYRFAIGFAVFTSLFLIWVNLGVGIIGSEENPINLMYYIVLLTGIIGAAVSRLRSYGMSMTFYVTAVTHVIVTLIAIALYTNATNTAPITGILSINIIFVLMWVGAAMLFKLANTSSSK